jgi:hypothetical protein
LPRKRQIFDRRPLYLLDDGMQCDQHTFVKPEKHTRLAFARQRRTDLPKTAAQRATQRKSNRPTELYFGNVAANGSLVRTG